MLDYGPTSFSQGRMDFAWEELSEEERAAAWADWEAGRGLIGGDPRLRPGSDTLPPWGVNRPFFRALALDDPQGDNGPRLRAALAGERPVEVEIGFGRGDFLLDRAQRHPATLLLGLETRTKATRLMLSRLERMQVDSCWLSDDDARFALPRVLPAGRVSMVHILFPDPWWKAQHLSRRLFSPPFVELLATLLHAGGLLHFKSDVREYGDLVRYLVAQNSAFARHDPALAELIGPSAPTHREAWCARNSKPVFASYFLRK
jgi:tRNA (guanine-N7-)-methyltransferase